MSLTGGRVYDATTSVAAADLTIGTLINQETLGLAGTGTLGDKNVGQNKAVGLGTLNLTDGTGLASNYTLVDGGRIATITQANLTVTTSDVVKTYNGTLGVAGATTAPVAIVLAGSNTQMFGSDTLSGGSYAFTDANAGSSDRTVTVAGVTVNDGNGGNNYAVTYASNITSTINKAAITVSTSNVIKTYDATTSALGTPVVTVGSLFTNVSNANTADTLSGGTYAFVGENVSRAGGVSSGAVLSDKVVTASGVTVNDGNNGGNYVVTYADNNTSTINPYAISLTGNRVYDGTTDVNSEIFSLSQRVGQETLGLTGIGTISNAHVTLNGATPQSQILGSVGTLALTDGSGLAINYTLAGGTHNVTVNQRPLTLNAVVPNKIYDGNTAIQVTSLTLGNQVVGETLSLVYNPFANFIDKTAGENKGVTIVNVLAQTTPSARSTDYVTLPTTYQATASIFKKDVTVVGVVATDKIYDGTTTNIINTSVSALAGLVQGDQISISSMTGTFSNKNVGTDIAVIGSEVTFAGPDAGNYNLIQPTGLKANILPRTLIASATGVSRQYDGTTNAQVNISDNRIAGDIITYDYSGSFLDENIGTNKFIAVQVNRLTGTDGGNYTLAANPSAFADVTRRVITFTPVVTTKTYDGTTAATGTLATNVIAGDNVTVTFGNVRFDDPDAGAAKSVTLTGISVTGDLSNYSWSPSNTTATGTGTITPYIVNLTGTKVYDGAATIEASKLVMGALVGNQTLALAGNGAFADRNVGTDKLIDPTGLTLLSGSGANSGLASNYTFAGGVQVASITPASLVVTASDAVKTYDGSVSMVGATQAPAPIVKIGSGTQLFDADSLSGGNFAFVDANVSRNANGAVLGDKSVTVSGVTINDGNNGANYTVTYADNRTSTINPFATTVTALAQTKVYDASTLAGTERFTFGPMIGSDAIASVTLTYDSKNIGQGTKLILPSTAVGSAGTILGNYTISYVADTASSITPAILSGVSDIVIRDKVYDGTTAAEVASAAFNGIYAGDDISVALSVGSFDTKDVGLRSVVISGISLGGSDASNYLLLSSAGTATGQILQRPITIGALSQTKVYDGTTQVTALGQGIGFDVSNMVQGEGIATVALSYADPNVARGAGGAVLNNKTVTVSSALAATNTDLANYAITYAANTTSTITPAPLQVTVLDLSKMYDGMANATGTAALTDDSPRLIGSDTLSGGTFTFTDVNAGTNKTVAVSNVTVRDGNNGGNYTISYVNNTASTITPFVVSLTGGRAYDATTSVSAANLTIGTLVGSETLGLTGSGTLGDKNVGQNKAVGLGTLTLTSATGLATNYTLLNGNRTANIFAAPLTLTTSNVVKTYDGGLSVAGATVAPAPIVKAGSNTQLFGLDSVSGGNYAFTNANAGNGNRSVTVAGVTVNDGNNGLNYAVTYTSNSTSTINPKALTVSALSQTKVYDATTAVNSSALGMGYSVIGLVGSETVSGATLVYANADVSRNSSGTVLSDKAIVVSGAVAGANTQLSNYAISYVNNTSSSITPKPVTLSAMKVYDGSADLTGWVTINTGIAGQVLSYANARANSAEAGVIGNYISQIVLVSTPTSLASNFALPVLSAITTPVSISIPQPAVVTISSTYENLPVVNSPTSAPALASPVVVLPPAPSPTSGGTTSGGSASGSSPSSQTSGTGSTTGTTLGGATTSGSSSTTQGSVSTTAGATTGGSSSGSSPSSQTSGTGSTTGTTLGGATTSGSSSTTQGSVSTTAGATTGGSSSGSSTSSQTSGAGSTTGTTSGGIIWQSGTGTGTTSGGTTTSGSSSTTQGSGSTTAGTTAGGSSSGSSTSSQTSGTGSTTGTTLGGTASSSSASPQQAGTTTAADTGSVGDGSTSADASGRGFISVDPINPPALDAGTVFKLTVPQAAFRHARGDARITLSAASPDGSALPAWATFDTTRNILSGTAPDGVAQLDVEVTAVDEEGYQISVILNLQFSKNP